MIRHIILIILFAIPAIGFPYTINFSKGIDPTSIDRLHPKLKDIALFIAGFCEQNGIKFVITSTIRTKERNLAVGGKSATHTEGRAFDMSIREQWGWDDYKILILVQKLEKIYGHLGAYSNMNGRQVLVFNHSVDGEGTQTHLHIQVYRGLPWK